MSITPLAATSPSIHLPDLLLPHADLILRSSDTHDFHVQKLYVVGSSPVLEKQIAAAASDRTGPEAAIESSCEATTRAVDGEAKSGTRGEISLPVVRLAEGHSIISCLLTFIFPVPPVLPPTIEQIIELLSVAQKYEMNTVLIRIRDSASRRDPPIICSDNAFHVYSLAWNCGLLEETRLAAEETLKSKMTIQDLEDKLDIMSSAALYDLWKYRQGVLTDLGESLGDNFFDSEVYRILLGANLDCEQFGENEGLPWWLDHYLDTVIEDPVYLDLTTFHLTLASHASPSPTDGLPGGCKHCPFMSAVTIRKFWTALTAAVRESTRKAESDFLLAAGKIHFQSSTSTTTDSEVLPGSPLPEEPNRGLDMEGADVILQSSDLTSFRVHKSILAISSPFFKDMFSLPQPRDDPDNEIDGLPVVHVPEGAEVLHHLLTILYPFPPTIPDTYEKALELLAVAQKYIMNTVLSNVRSKLALPSTEAAFRAYAIAHNKQLIPEMETAARLTLDHSMTFEAISDCLVFFEGSALSDLVHFRKRCHDNLLSFLKDFVNGDDSLSKMWFVSCQKKSVVSASEQNKPALAGWLRELMVRHLDELQGSYTCALPKPTPIRREFVTALQTHNSGTSCSPCSVAYANGGEDFRDQLWDRLSKARDQEPFKLDAQASNPSGDSGNTDA